MTGLEVEGAEPAEGALDGEGWATRPFEGDLLIVENLSRKIGSSVRVRDADDDDRRARRGHRDCLLDRRRVADGLEDDVGAKAVGQLANRAGQVDRFRIEDVADPTFFARSRRYGRGSDTMTV